MCDVASEIGRSSVVSTTTCLGQHRKTHQSFYFGLLVRDILAGYQCPDSKVHGSNMWPIWGRQNPCGLHVGPMNFVIWGREGGPHKKGQSTWIKSKFRCYIWLLWNNICFVQWYWLHQNWRHVSTTGRNKRRWDMATWKRHANSIVLQWL